MKSPKNGPSLFWTGFFSVVLFAIASAIFDHWREVKAAIAKLFGG